MWGGGGRGGKEGGGGLQGIGWVSVLLGLYAAAARCTLPPFRSWLLLLLPTSGLISCGSTLNPK